MLGVVRARYGDSHVYLYHIAFVPRSGCRTNERTNERVRTYLAQPVRERAHEGKYLEIRGSGVFVRGWERGRRDVARVV